MDDLGVEIAYAFLVMMAWTWALSQVREAVIAGIWGWPVSWQTTTALWMVTKASFFTFVGSVWWFNWFHPHAHAAAIYALTIAHTAAFVHWVLLPHIRPGAPGAQVQVTEHRTSRDERQDVRDVTQNTTEVEQGITEIEQNEREKVLDEKERRLPHVSR